MFYCHLCSVVWLLRVVFMSSFLGLFICNVSGVCIVVDWLPKLDINESYLHLYPLLWTNFWLLPPFYFFLAFFFPASPWLTFWMVFFYWTYVTELIDFSVFNYTYCIAELNQFNNLLTNNLNKYHPFLFFLSTHLCFMLIYVNSTRTLNLKRFYGISILLQVRKLNSRLTPLIITALVLGGVWAFHEASWGGFWNWDSSETFGLLFLLFSLYVLHIRLKLQLTTQISTSFLGFGSLLVTMYCFLQLNFDLLSHNFGIKFLHLFSNSFFYKEVIVVSLYFLTLTWLLFWWDKFQVFTLTVLSSTTKLTAFLQRTLFWWQLVQLYVAVLVGYSLTQLVNYTLFSLFHINWLNITLNLPPVVVLCYLYFTYWFISSSKPRVEVWCFVLVTNINLIYSFLINVCTNFRLYQIVHVVLIVTLAVNLLAYKVNFLIWTFISTTGVVSLFNTSLVANNVWYACDALFVDQYVQYNTVLAELSLWVTNFTSNTPSINQLLLVFYNIGCTSLYHLTNNLTSLVTLIVVPYVSVLWGCACLTTALLVIWHARTSQRF
jgi:hypothetical protein